MTSRNKINQIKAKLQKLNQKNTKTALEIVQELFGGLAGADLDKQTIQQYTDTLFKFWHKSEKDCEVAEAFKIIQNWFADKENDIFWCIEDEIAEIVNLLGELEANIPSGSFESKPSGTQAEENINFLEKELEKINNELTDSNTLNQELSKKIRNLNANISFLLGKSEEAKEGLDRAIADLNQERTNREKEVRKLKVKLEDKTREFDKLNRAMNLIESAPAESLKLEKTILESKNQKLREEVKEFSDALFEARDRETSYQKAINELAVENKELDQKLSDQKDENEQLWEQIKNVKNLVSPVAEVGSDPFAKPESWQISIEYNKIKEGVMETLGERSQEEQALLDQCDDSLSLLKLWEVFLLIQKQRIEEWKRFTERNETSPRTTRQNSLTTPVSTRPQIQKRFSCPLVSSPSEISDFSRLTFVTQESQKSWEEKLAAKEKDELKDDKKSAHSLNIILGLLSLVSLIMLAYLLIKRAGEEKILKEKKESD